MIVKKYILTLCLLATGCLFGQTVTQNFNHPLIKDIERECWEFNNVTTGFNNSINIGSEKRQAEANMNGFFTSATVSSPYIKFNGTGNISFDHKLNDNEASSFVYNDISLYLMDPTGAMTGPIFTHLYRQISTTNPRPNGDPTIVQTASVPVSWSGYYRVVWYWTGLFSSTYGHMDDVSIPGTFSAADTLEINGFCPALIDTADTVCAGLLNDYYTTFFVRAGRSYSWSWDGPSGGAIDATVDDPYDATIAVDWAYTPGNYVLHAQESSSGGYPGNWVNYNIYVSPPPTYSLETDTVCKDEVVTVNFTGLGTAPFTVDYSTDLGSQTVVIPGNTGSFTLPAGVTYIDFTQIQDTYGCTVDPATLGPTTIYFYPGATAGPIYHN